MIISFWWSSYILLCVTEVLTKERQRTTIWVLYIIDRFCTFSKEM